MRDMGFGTAAGKFEMISDDEYDEFMMEDDEEMLDESDDVVEVFDNDDEAFVVIGAGLFEMDRRLNLPDEDVAGRGLEF